MPFSVMRFGVSGALARPIRSGNIASVTDVTNIAVVQSTPKLWKNGVDQDNWFLDDAAVPHGLRHHSWIES
jgi:hypothetical protein